MNPVLLPVPYVAKNPGVYAIVNRDNGKVYVGSAARLHTRWNGHRCDVLRGKHNSIYFQRAFRANPSAFYIEVLEEFESAEKEHRLKREQFWMDFFKSYIPENGYNISPVARSCEGICRTDEFKQKTSEGLKKVFARERSLGIKRTRLGGNHLQGTKWTLERRQKRSRDYAGRKIDPRIVAKATGTRRKNKCSCKPVECYSVEGELLGRFDSISKAEEAFGCRSNIHAVCKGKRKNALGFIWKYA